VSDNALRLIFNRTTTTSATHDLGNLTQNRFSPSTPFSGSTTITINGATAADILSFVGTTPQIDITSAADTFGGNLDIDSFQMAGYGSWQRDTLYMNAAVGFGYHDTDASRAVVVGTTTSTANADYDSVHVSAVVEAGKDILLSLTTTFTPFVGVEYSHSNRDDFTESGAGTANSVSMIKTRTALEPNSVYV
jgi:outer membrane autotransporter protein